MAIFRTMKFPVAEAMKRVTLHVDVTGVQTWRMRLWLGGLLLHLAARVIGCGIRFDGIDRQPTPTNAIGPQAQPSGTPSTCDKPSLPRPDPIILNRKYGGAP